MGESGDSGELVGGDSKASSPRFIAVSSVLAASIEAAKLP